MTFTSVGASLTSDERSKPMPVEEERRPKPMAGTLECDLGVIGGGLGGLTIAAGTAQRGAHVVFVEAGRKGR